MKMKELLADPTKWTKGANAKDNTGMMVVPSSPNATCFCLLGAAIRCYPQNSETIFIKLINKVPNKKVVAWNDHPDRTHTEVLALVTELDI
jgi:hypothetical protein